MMHNHFSGGNTQGTPPPPFRSMQPQHHQPAMVGRAPTPSVIDKYGRRYTQEEFQQLLQREREHLREWSQEQLHASRQAQPMPIDPQLFRPSATGRMASPMPIQLMGQAPTPRLLTTTAEHSFPLPPRFAGAKRENPSGNDAYREGSMPKKAMYEGGPVPKIGMFPTAPPSRPNSAQGIVGLQQGKNSSHVRKDKDGRLNKEAFKHGVHNLDMSKQRFNMVRSEDELHRAGHATAATPGYTKQMMELKKNAIAQEMDSAQKKARNGAKISEGALSKPAAATRQVQKPEVIDLTDADTSQSQHPSKPQPNIYPQPSISVTAKSAPMSEHAVPVARHLYHHALRFGVHMSSVEHGNDIQTAMQAWLSHHADIAASRSLLDPSPARMQQLLQENASSNHAPTNTLDPEHAEALGLSTNFNVQDTLNKVRRPSFDYGYSGNGSKELEPASQEAVDICTRDADGSLRAPDVAEEDISEQTAKLRYELFLLAAEQRERRGSRSRWAGDATGEATWR